LARPETGLLTDATSGYRGRVNPLDFYTQLQAAPLLAFLLFACMWLLGFIVSAFLVSLWVRLVIYFLRKTLDREYAHRRGPTPRAPVGREAQFAEL
jgi:hypothetical protein